VEGTVVYVDSSDGSTQYRVEFIPYDDLGWHCSCKGFQFQKKCKHLAVAKGQFCGWLEQIDGGYEGDGKCPKCGGPVTVYTDMV
jgi:hypothetical protein